MSGDPPSPATSIPRWGDLPWSEIDAFDRARTVCILPVGATEAHGPHLPLLTDGIIAAAMAEECARRLAEHDLLPLLLPPLDYSAAPFAAGFAGTISLRPETVTELLVDVGRSLAFHGFSTLALANVHLDPAHLGALHAAVSRLLAEQVVLAVFPDLTRKPWALRLGEEFKSGACHAGRFESSVVLAARPELVREAVRRELPANPASLSTAIRDGKHTFAEAGGARAYFGDPAAAGIAEGEETIATLGTILAEAVLAARRL
ncbi:MAG TPA: creatininase family protein [Thermoanaerobaculia bacterium]|jgi:creatinine amidohydrolase|nr:creatininase family protein [Thermoanaerobaculia bacterium]